MQALRKYDHPVSASSAPMLRKTKDAASPTRAAGSQPAAFPGAGEEAHIPRLFDLQPCKPRYLRIGLALIRI